MPLPTLRYPLDETGVNPDNLVSGEIKTLPNLPRRALAPTYGPFYAEGLIVYDHLTQQPLVKNTHYKLAELLKTPTKKYRKEVYGLIIITDPNVSSEVSITYQALGGPYQRDLSNLIEAWLNTFNNLPVDWAYILNKPDVFPVDDHFHALSRIYGFEFVVSALEGIRTALELSNVPIYEGLMAWVNQTLQSLQDDYNNFRLEIESRLVNGLVRIKGPTALTPSQVAEYTITDFDSFIDYTYSAISGTLVKNEELLTFTAPANEGDSGFIINGRTFTIPVISSGGGGGGEGGGDPQVELALLTNRVIALETALNQYPSLYINRHDQGLLPLSPSTALLLTLGQVVKLDTRYASRTVKVPLVSGAKRAIEIMRVGKNPLYVTRASNTVGFIFPEFPTKRNDDLVISRDGDRILLIPIDATTYLVMTY